MPIKLLAPEVVARIAAGEVVERPASVVKELVENALDAGASQITVETQGGGVGLIRVTDNGSGIPSGEVGLAFERHATSKINDINDLESIGTLGFRGEALASIAAVADVELSTCAEGEAAGSYVRLEHGAIADITGQGRSRGTTIAVRNLFRNVPARLKFLKSTATENGRIAEAVTQYALAFPDVRFTLSLDGRTTLQTPGSGRLLDAVIEVYGAETARNMVEVRRDSGWAGGSQEIIVEGLVGSPALSRANRSYISFFVNRRWVQSRLLAWAVEEAYHGLLMTGKHPVAVVNLSILPAEIDINIHPAKTEIKFRDERRVFAAVQRSVRRALLEPVAQSQIEDPVATYTAPPPTARTFSFPATPPTRSAPLPSLSRPVPALSLPALRLLGQVAGCYIVTEGPDGLYLVDQHAAHERVLFDQITEQRSRQHVEVQGLLEPAIFEVGPAQDAGIRSRLDDLAGFGFSLEPFGERSYLVRGVPACLNGKEWSTVLREIADSPSGGDDWQERVTASIACHGAVRAGQTLSDEEMRALLRALEQSTLPNTCPHGRPTMLQLSSSYLEREFGRRG